VGTRAEPPGWSVTTPRESIQVPPGSKSVALFQAEYPVTFQTANAARMLAEAGYEVDLFFFRIEKSFRLVEFDRLGQYAGVRIHDLTIAPKLAPPAPSVRTGAAVQSLSTRLGNFLRSGGALLGPVYPSLRAAYRRARRVLRKASQAFESRQQREEKIIPRVLIDQTLQVMSGRQYSFLIGLEKKGLIWSGQIARTLGIPFIYYSTELYLENYYWKEDEEGFKRLRAAECRYHRKALATIVQDPERGRVLFEGNGVSMTGTNIYYSPVSVMGSPSRGRSWFLHDVLGLPRDRKIILYFGLIWENRYVLELTEAAQSFPANWVLVMHGYADSPQVLEKIRALDRHNRVVTSLQMVPSDRIHEVVASADVGLALYASSIPNDYLTAFSSEKMAWYMCCGTPFVAFDYPGYRRLADEDRCGMVIGDLKGLPDAVHQILLRHEEFRQNAYQAFARHYDFARNFAKVIEGLNRL
jgi:glycosyltransferase involved in cell wall biosynthesis